MEEIAAARGSPLPMEVHRTLVKSPPELWAELSDVEALTRHLAAFGDITIKRVVPETTVAWEGELASGTVELSASGWGTKVTLRAQPVEREAPAEPLQPVEPEPEPEPVAVAVAAPRRRWRFWSRAELPGPTPGPDPVPPTPTPAPGPPPPPDPNPPQIRFDPTETEALLSRVLDDLGQAHHRPFQR